MASSPRASSLQHFTKTGQSKGQNSAALLAQMDVCPFLLQSVLVCGNWLLCGSCVLEQQHERQRESCAVKEKSYNEREIMCNEKSHTLCIKFLIKKCFLEWNLPQLLPSVNFSVHFTKHNCADFNPCLWGCCYRMCHIWQIISDTAGAKGCWVWGWADGLKTKQSFALICKIEVEGPAYCLLQSAFLCYVWKHSRKITNFFWVPTLFVCLVWFYMQWKVNLVRTFLANDRGFVEQNYM